jgi:hypothetical protein
MSKQSEAKLAQGYSTKPMNCGNCAHRWFMLGRHGVEREQRCEIGTFAIKKTATCAKHEWKEAK